MDLSIAQSAIADLQAIQAHYREQGVPQVGDDFVAAILARCEMLQRHPDAGRVVPEFEVDHIREWTHPPFRVVYLRQTEEVVLIRVWLSERQFELPES